MPAKKYDTDEQRREAQREGDRRYRSTPAGKEKRRAATAAYRRRLVETYRAMKAQQEKEKAPCPAV